VSRTLAVLVTTAVPLGGAFAADTYWQPQAEARVENNDNFNLTPGGSPDSDVYGYIADLQALIGIATPRSDTSLRPRIRIQEYPDRDDIEKVESFFDLRSLYKWERAQLRTTGRYSRQDSYNVDTVGGEFDPLDPDAPVDSDTGRVLTGETRTRVMVLPEFTFNATERTQLGVAADYQAVRYDSDGVSTQVDFDYYGGNGFVGWSLNPRSDLRVGAFVSTYEAQDDSVTTDAYGGSVGYEYRWSEVAGIAVDMFYEQDDATRTLPVPSEDSMSGWGGNVSAYGQGEVSTWRVSAGRSFIPTGAGGKAQSDQFRMQYGRDITQRVRFTGAARYEARTGFTAQTQADDRDFARVDLGLRWMMSTTWYLEGGYAYIWEDRESASGDAVNNRLFVGVGYKGLDRQRR
jgi:hypothetical protein